jgi:hypothetical protein
MTDHRLDTEGSIALLSLIFAGAPQLARAVCRGRPELLDANDEDGATVALALCRRCPSIDPCRLREMSDREFNALVETVRLPAEPTQPNPLGAGDHPRRHRRPPSRRVGGNRPGAAQHRDALAVRLERANPRRFRQNVRVA